MFNKNKTNNTNRPRQARRVERANTYYYKQAEGGEAPRPSRQDTKWWHQLPTYAAAVVIMGCFVYSLLLSTTPKVVIINEQNEAVQPFLRDGDAYQAVIQAELDQSVLHRSKLTFNTDKVAADLQSVLPEVTDVSITLPIVGRNPVVYLRIAEPAFTLGSTAGTFVIDEQGRAVIPSQELPDAAFAQQLVAVTDESGASLEVGRQAIPKDQVQFITNVATMLRREKVKVKKMVLPARINELHVYPAGEPHYVKYNFLLDAGEQTGKYLATRAQLQRDKAPAKQYIDVRVEDRVYVR